MKAFFTVEASMLFPIFLFLCVFLVYLGFYQYNRCILEQSMRYTLVRGKELSGAAEEEYEQIMGTLFTEVLEKQYLIGMDGGISCEVDSASMEISYIGTMPVPWLRITNNEINNDWRMSVCVRAEKWNPVNFIRICNKVKGE